uniref:Ppx/GppA phosphatase N-terminal domain-containing protein n=1 Tax=Vannella robusta TaxID=1487602 RepID=A0A7S4HXK0_9EUKA
MARVLGAFDMGSGAVKLTIARVMGGMVERIEYSKQKSVLVAHAVKKSADRSIPDSVAATLGDTMKELMEEGEKCAKPTDYRGAATAVYRESVNGEKIIESLSQRFQFPITIISQELEGYLGFLTAAQGVEPSEISSLVSWDTGGASFQLAAVPGHPKESIEGMKLIEGPLGSSKVTSLMIESVQMKNFNVTQTANPASLEECKQTLNKIKEVLSNIEKPPWITEESKVVGIGGHSCAFRLVKLANGLDIFSESDIWSCIEKYQHASDEDLTEYPEHEMFFPKLLLLTGVMQYFGIKQVKYLPSNGSTTGMFLYDPLWK